VVGLVGRGIWLSQSNIGTSEWNWSKHRRCLVESGPSSASTSLPREAAKPIAALGALADLIAVID
jgi:hypothetical protein